MCTPRSAAFMNALYRSVPLPSPSTFCGCVRARKRAHVCVHAAGEYQRRIKNMQRQGKLQAGQTVKREVETFFKTCDDDDDGKVVFKEYKKMWIKTKKKSKTSGTDEPGEDSLRGRLKASLQQAQEQFEKAREYARNSPYVAVSGVVAMSGAMYVGGLAARIW